MSAPSPDDTDDPAAPSEAPPEAMGLRERKKWRTRRTLQRAALTLVAERGLEHVTTDDIAAAAEVSPRTFFNYFIGKEDALVGTDAEAPARLNAALAARPAGEPPLAAVRAVCVALAEEITDSGDLWQLRLRVVEANPSLAPALIGSLGRNDRALAGAVGDRMGLDPDQDPYPYLLASVASAAMRAALQHYRMIGFTRPLTEVLTETFDSISAGLPAPPRE